MPEDHLAPTDLVVLMPPEPIARFFADRNYLPRGVRLLKRVHAVPERICRVCLVVTIDGVVMATARERDHRGRPLPASEGCRTIVEGEVLANWQSADSLDGRYFWDRAASLWTFEER